MCSTIGNLYERRNGSNITLLGLDYSDRLHGPQKLAAALDRIKPDLIVYEFNDEDLSMLSKFVDDLESRIKDTIGESDLSVTAFDGLLDLVIPFSVGTSHEYAELNGIQVAGGLLPQRSKSLFYRAAQLGNHLVEASIEQGTVDQESISAISKELRRRYGALPSPIDLVNRWDHLEHDAGTLSQFFRYAFHRFFITPHLSRTHEIFRATYNLAGTSERVAFAVEMGQLTEGFGTLYSRVKHLGVNREVLLSTEYS